MEATLDHLAPVAEPTSRSRIAGRVVTGIATAFLIMDAAMKVAHVRPVSEASARLGLPDHLNPGLGVVLSACMILHLIPRTAAIGAALLTGYLGGAVAMHLRIEDPLWSHTLFPVYFGTLIWLGLYLRDARLRALVRA